ncbi:ATP-grasp domain-containing protein [Streptomyces sp. NPDC001709]
MSEPVCLLGAGGSRAGENEFRLARIAASHPVILLDAAVPAWARQYLVRHIAVDLADPVCTVAAVKSYRSRHELRGVLTYMPEHLGTAALIAELLQTPSSPLEALAACSDLAELRRRLTRHGVPQPRWAEVLDAQSAAAQAELLGYPALIKPTRKRGRIALHVHNPAEVRTAYELVAGNRTGRPIDRCESALIEEYLCGHQVSAEAIVLDDADIRIAAITRTVVGPPPALQVLRHCIFAHDTLLHNPILRQIVTRTIRALGITLGVLNVCMMFTPTGPRITDVSAHLADDLIPMLVQQATGIDLPGIAADLSTGRTVNVIPTRQRAAAIQFLYPGATGYVRRLAVHPHVNRQPLLDRIVLTQQVGNHVTHEANATIDDRIAHIVVLGPDGPSCHSALDQIAQHIDTDVVPSFPACAEAACRRS